MKKIIFILGVCLLLAFGTVLATLRIKQTHISADLTVVTTLFPLYDFAKAIGGDYVAVTLLLPPGTEPHSFEPKPSDILTINQSDIFIYTGASMEPWAEDIIQGMHNDTVTIVNVSSGIPHTHISDHHHAQQENHEHDAIDPHIWLNFDNAKTIVQTIADAFASKDPAHAAYYEERAQAYINKLTNLDQTYQQMLSQCQHTDIIYAGHYAFGYLADAYGLHYVAAQGISPDAEPTANDLIALVNQIKTTGATAIFYEALSSPVIAETLSKETGVPMLLLHPAGNISKNEYTMNMTYLSLMEKNLEQLSKGLVCQ